MTLASARMSAKGRPKRSGIREFSMTFTTRRLGGASPAVSFRSKKSVTGFVPGPKAVGSFVPKLAAKAFEKFGFATAAVLTDWHDIVGPQLAAMTAPERLRWPREMQVDPATAPGPRAGATLMLRVDPARALDVQYKTAQIIERINVYFGYAAVTEIRLIQAPLPGKPTRPKTPAPAPGPKAVLEAALGYGGGRAALGAASTEIEDADLRQALQRLGAAVSAAPHRHA